MVKVLGWLVLLATGVLSLPVAAWFLDGQGTENWVLPVQVAVMLAVGALLGVALPGFVGGTTGRRLGVGAAYGLGAALVGLVVFFLLLSGLDGA